MREREVNKLRVYSLNLAAYLRSKGFEYQPVLSIEKGLVIFLFDDTREVSNTITEYRRNKEIQNFVNSYRLVREDIQKCK